MLRRVMCLSVAIVGTCAAMLVATLLAQASSLSGVAVWWTTPQDVSQSDGAESRGPLLAVDDTGHTHLIWMDDRDAPEESDLYYIGSDDGGNTWSSSPERIDTPVVSHQASLAVGSNGVHACWWDAWVPAGPYELFYAERMPGGWSDKERVVYTETSDISDPSIAEASEYIHVTWANELADETVTDLYYSQRAISETEWTTATLVLDTGAQSERGKLAADASGNLHLVWEEASPTIEVMYISATVDAGQTAWSSPVTLSAGINLHSIKPDIVVGDDGMVHIAFSAFPDLYPDLQDIYYARFPISNVQSVSPTVIPLSSVDVTSLVFNVASPSIALDADNNVHVVWGGKRGADIWDHIYYATSGDQGASWSPPMAISGPNDASPHGAATIATMGTVVHVAWQQRVSEDDSDVYYAHGLPAMSLLPLALKDYS